MLFRSIKYQLPVHNWVTLKVYNVLGMEVEKLVDELQNAGFKSVSFDARNLASGVYFYRLAAGEFVDVRKMILLK